MDIIQLLENARHDIRHPLEGIRDFLRQNQSTGVMDSTERGILTSATEALLDYQESMLRVAGIEKNFHPCAIIDQVITLLRPKASCKKIALEFFCPTLPNLFGDSAKFSRILTELTVNAIKFTEKGVIRLSLSGEVISTSQYLLHFEVHDTGCGIDKIKEGTGLSAIQQWVKELSGTFNLVGDTTGGTCAMGMIPFALEKIEPLPIIDLSLGKKRIAQTEEAARDMLAQLASHLKKEKKFFSNALDQKNWLQLAEHNHRLLGALRYCGAPRLETAAMTLEKIVSTHANTQDIALAAAALLEEMNRFCGFYIAWSKETC